MRRSWVSEFRTALEITVAGVTEAASGVSDFVPMGTGDLPAAVAALSSSERGDEDAARRVDRAFTANPPDLPATGEAGLEFGYAVLMMRAALRALDEELAADAAARPGGSRAGR